MRPTDGSRGVDELALAAWLGERARGARVLYVGDASTGAADALARTAREVIASDPHAIADRVERGTLRVVRATTSLVPEGEGDFTLVVVADVGRTALTTREHLAALARALAPGGTFVAAVGNRDAPLRLARSAETAVSFAAFRALLGEVFPTVRLFGQAPFVGYAVADIAVSAVASIVFDGTLLGEDTELPERYVAVCRRDGDVSFEPYAVVQVPAAAALAGTSVQQARDESPERERQTGVLRNELSAVRERAERLSRELDDERAKVSRLHASERPPQPSFEPRIAELEAELLDHREVHDAVQVERGELQATITERTAALAELDGEVERLRIELLRVREESETRVVALRTAREELEKLRATPASSPEEFGRLETALQDRARRVIELDAEVARRGTLVRDLTEEISRLAAGGAVEEGALAEIERRASEAAGRAEDARAQLATSRVERDAAVQRALQAEAARVDAQFRADELEGRLAELRTTERSTLEALHLREAEGSGAIRGLRSRAAELDQLRGAAEARLAVLQLDLSVEKGRIVALEAAVAEAGPRAEARAETDVRVATLEGEREGLRLRLADAEASLVAIERQRQGADAERASLVSRAEHSARDATSVRAALDEARAALRDLGAQLAAPPGARPARAFDEVDGGPAEPSADAGMHQKRIDALLVEVRDRETLLRSLTAQLEERDDRLRALEQQRTAPGTDAPHAHDAGAVDLAALEERVGRLTEQLDREREARRAAETLAAHGARSDGGEPDRLRHELAKREAEILRLEGRARTVDGDTRALRDSLVAARAGLEELLGNATSRGDAALADRIGALLRTLSRF